jgi:nicotinate phosphoribosyltransferase
MAYPWPARWRTVFIQACDNALEAFRAFAALYPETILLVDTHDTLQGVRHVIALARELGDAFRIRAVRLDSGDLADLASKARAMLDEAGLHRVEIFASGSLDEDAVAGIVARGAPITGFGVGTSMGVSTAPPNESCSTTKTSEPRDLLGPRSCSSSVISTHRF